MTRFNDAVIPYFAWDRNITAGEIRRRLENGSVEEKQSLAAWILREAAFDDVWQFLNPRTVGEMLPVINRQLGRKRDFWNYIIRTWHELGKVQGVDFP
jgi:hypothetical protein